MDLLKSMKTFSTNPSKKLFKDGDSLPSQGAKQRMCNADKSVPSIDKIQRAWRPPPQEDPIDEDDDEGLDASETMIDLGSITTDAVLYVVKEKCHESVRDHYILKMPSSLPKVDFSLDKSRHIFNLLVVDVSASMSKCWDDIENGWNQNVAPKLRGRTVIYTFGTSVIFRREGTALEKGDFDSGGTDLTGAFQTIVNEVNQCKEKYVNVFLITDGDHNATGVEPSAVIDVMQYPRNKVCNVFVLGVGNDFPVSYSVDIRSHLHNGSSNVPYIFWPKEKEEIVSNMIDISKVMYDGSSTLVKLGVAGSVLPGINTKTSFHLMEWVCLPYSDVDTLRKLPISFAKHKGHLILDPMPVTLEVLKAINQQWNTVIIQRHRNGEKVPSNILDLKQRIFNTHINEIMQSGDKRIKVRLIKKNAKKEEMKFMKELSELKVFLTREKFKDPLDLAETILSTTVVRNTYKIKSLQLKGHTDSDFDLDRKSFLQILEKIIPEIRSISVLPDDCCRVTMASTITDLQDDDFAELLNESDKFTFLKNFTITGIPVIAPVRDSVILNPWTFSVTKMLRSPYTIMSYNAMESAPDIPDVWEDKAVRLKQSDRDSSYNAVVPVFSPSVASVMKPIVKTRLYAMCVTFATTKNPHVIDSNIHMASLSVTWLYCLSENPSHPRAEYAQSRMESIEATALLYMDESRYAEYCRVLIEDTPQALMTESKVLVNNKPLKCESLVKPVFFLYMMKKYTEINTSFDTKQIMRLILLEYVGRCLSRYESDHHHSTPYCNLFAESLDDQSKRKKFIYDYVSSKRKEIVGNESILLEQYYTLEGLVKAAKKVAASQSVSLKGELLTKIPLRVDTAAIKQLKKVSTAGDISWFTLRAFASEIGLQKTDIDELFSEESVFVYTAHALHYRSSRDRLSNPVKGFAESYNFVFEKVQEESSRNIIDEFRKEIVTFMEDVWLKAYFDVHAETVKPMTRQQVISEARQRGVEVSEETFDQVFKRFRPTGLLSNACQTRACPYFLQPHKSYSQHASVERTKGDPFVHSLHKGTHQQRNSDLETIINTLVSGNYTKDQSAISEVAVRKLSSEIERLKLIYQEMF